MIVLRLLLLAIIFIIKILPIALIVLEILLLIMCVKRSFDEYKSHMFKCELIRYDRKKSKNLILSTTAVSILIPLTLWFVPITTYHIFDPDNVLIHSDTEPPDDGKLYMRGAMIGMYGRRLNDIPYFIAPIAICNRLDDDHIIVRYVRGLSFLKDSLAYAAVIFDSNEIGFDYHFVNDIDTNPSYPWN